MVKVFSRLILNWNRFLRLVKSVNRLTFGQRINLKVKGVSVDQVVELKMKIAEKVLIRLS